MGTDLHEEAVDFVAERLREFAFSGRLLRAERAALVQYATIASVRSPGAVRAPERQMRVELDRALDQPRVQPARPVENQHAAAVAPAQKAGVSPLLPTAASVAPSERLGALQEIEQRAAVCGKCASIARGRKSVVRASGSVHAEILFVGDVPSTDEDASGEAFQGVSGEMMDKMLMAMGLKREEVFLAPALRCRPDAPLDLPRKPTDAERTACLPFLTELISVLRPRVIVAMGAEAYRALFGREVLVGRVRSVWGDYSGIPVMTTFHPAHLITNPAVSVKRQVWEDLLKVLELLGHPISEKQRGYFLPKR